MTEGQLPRTAAREQMSLARMEMIFRVGGADDYDYNNIVMAMVALKFEMVRKIHEDKKG